MRAIGKRVWASGESRGIVKHSTIAAVQVGHLDAALVPVALFPLILIGRRGGGQLVQLTRSRLHYDLEHCPRVLKYHDELSV